MFFDTVLDLLQRKSMRQASPIARTASVAEAVRLMTRHDVSAVLVTGSNGLEGIVTERDVLRRLVAPGLDPSTTAVEVVMTGCPTTVGLGDRAARALALMSRGGFHHLPVVDGRQVRAVLSVGDLTEWLTKELRTQVAGALVAAKVMDIANRGRDAREIGCDPVGSGKDSYGRFCVL